MMPFFIFLSHSLYTCQLKVEESDLERKSNSIHVKYFIIHHFFCSRTQTYTHVCLLFSCLVVSDSLQLHAQQYTRLPCSSLPPGACSDFMSVESVITPNHLILFQPLLLLPSIFPSIRVFSNESALHIRWPRYWSFSFSISPSSEYSGLISLTGLISLLSKGLSRVFFNTTVWKHQFFIIQPSLCFNSHILKWILERP